MTGCEWIICETSGRWAMGLRAAIERLGANQMSSAASRRVHPAGSSAAHRPLLREVRSLDELTRQLETQPHAVALIEVRRTNLAAVLAWLSDVGSTYRHSRCIALLDTEYEDVDPASRDDLAAALRAAGAVEICESPRQSQRELAIGRRHDAARRSQLLDRDANQSVADWAWRLLPWQSADRQVG